MTFAISNNPLSTITIERIEVHECYEKHVCEHRCTITINGVDKEVMLDSLDIKTLFAHVPKEKILGQEPKHFTQYHDGCQTRTMKETLDRVARYGKKLSKANL